MKQYLLTIIAVLAAIILALFSLDTANNQYSTRSYKTYSYNPAPNAWSGAGDRMLSVLQEDNTGGAVAPLTEANATAGSLSALPEAGSPLGAPPAILEVSAMMELTPVQLPPLDAGMVNVTGGFDGNGQTAGYRVNPRPGEFAIAVPYDPSLLPQGFTEDDIQTYVYDRQYHRWIAIQRDSVNEAELLVCSRFRPWEKGLPHTQNDLANPQDALAQVQDMMSFASQGDGGGDSPLDFINAVLKTPEMPETSAYTPTSIKELKAADPLEGLTLMQPPTANNSGTANLSYPIEIPAGRQGMQPNLALTYSSGGGNGWLGVGWDISIPSITVETRWGVPRYDQQKESEVYVYEGEQLVTKDGNGNFREMPHRTKNWTNRHDLDQDSVEQFFPRKNEAFDSIVRHGNGPSNYWWTVTHKNGVTDYYGKYASDNGVNNSCVLRVGADNTSGAIGHWALAESVDPFGNSVRYYYDVVSEYVGLSSNIIGKQIYIERITYTNKSSEQGKYKILFNRQDDSRQDASVSANRGFLEVTKAKLCNMVVLFNEMTIREYMFFDTIGRFSNYKTRLTDVVRVDSICERPIGCVDSIEALSGMKVTRTHFDYFDAPQGDEIFGSAQNIYLSDDEVKSWFSTDVFNALGEGNSTALGSTRGKSWNVGGTASVGIGANVALTSLSVGGNFNYSRSKSEGALTLIDLDGDGLADKLFKIGKTLVYRPQIAVDDTTFTYGDTIHIGGVSDFLQEGSSTTSWGLQASAGIAYNGSWPTTRSTTTTYFSDVNADGLPDLITDDGVLFNVTEPGGRVIFRSFYTMVAENQNAGNGADSNIVHTSVDTCQGIIFDGEASDSIICFISWIRDTAFNAKEYNDHMPQQVLDFVDSLESTGEYYCEYRYWAHPPRVTDIIVYRKEMECLPIFSQTANSSIVTIPDPDLEAVKVWVPQKDGIVSIRSRFRLLNDSVGGMAQSKWRDGVSYAVQVCRGVTADNNYVLHADSYDTLFTRYVDKNDTTLKDTTFSVDLDFDDLVLFRLISGDNHDFDKVSWRQTITCSGGGGLDQYGVDENYYDSQENFVVSGRNFFAVPLEEDSSYIRVSADIYTSNPYTNDLFNYYNLKVKVLRNQNNGNPSTIAHDDWSLSNNMPHTHEYLELHNSQYIPVQQEDYVTFTITGPSLQKFDWSKVRIVPHVEYFHMQNGSYVKIQDYYPPVKAEIENFTETRTDSVYHTLFGPLYRGWGQFAYNNNDTTGGTTVHDRHIRVERLVTDMDMYPRSSGHANSGRDKINGFSDDFTHDTLHPQECSDITASYENAEVYNPLAKTTAWIEMQPDCKNQAWVGYGNVNYMTDSVMSNTRLPEYAADTNTIDIEEYDHPIPIVTNHDVKTVRKQNISRMKNHSLSFAFVPVISIGASFSSGENIILTDYMDLNGDRYPDIVGQSLVQYSNPWGGIGNPVPMGPFANGITKSETSSAGATFGGSFQMPSRGTSNNPKNSKISFDGSGNAGANLGGGNDNTVFSWMDVNGDGLPDAVSVDDAGHCYVSLNTGYGFMPASGWGNFTIRDGDSENAGFDFGANFNLGQTSIGGGVGVNYSRNRTKTMLMDFNGDGLPDMVEDFGNSLKVRYNMGNGVWSADEYVGGASAISFGRSYSESINASVTVGFTLFSILKVCVGISGSPYNKTFSRDSLQITDINSDGYPDYVTSNSEGEMTVRYNQSGKANLLRKVTNFTGSFFELDYDMPFACYEKPQRSWNLADVRVYNNDTLCPVGGNRTHTRFTYSNPNHNRVERMDFGYGMVTTWQLDTENGDSLYRYTVEEFNNRDFAKRGRKTRDCLYDSDSLPYVEHLYGDTIYDYAGSMVTDGGCTRTDVYVKTEADITNWYEGGSTARITSVTVREYDRYRNVVRYTHRGDTTHYDEWFTAEIDYASGMSHNLTALPVQIVVKNRSGNTLQKRTASYYPTGKLHQLVRYNNSSPNAQYDFTYDSFGNLASATLPANHNGQRLVYEYTFDDTVHTYPIKVKNTSLGFTSTAEYNLMYGKPTKTVDINGNEMRYRYDTLGRNTVILAPYEMDAGRPYTIRMEYHPKNYGSLDITASGAQSYACTYHYDIQHQSDPIRTTLISDGLGRLLQTKKDAEIGGQEVSLVTGKVEYDCFGRTVKQYHPFTEDTVQYASYNDSVTIGTATETEYDILDRQTRVKLPTHEVTRMEYGFGNIGGKTVFSATTTDALNNSVQVLKGTLGQQLKQVAPYGTTTLFDYDCLGQLKKSTDPDGYETFYDYDMFGQMVHRKHPDAGNDKYVYDPAGNLIRHTNEMGEILDYKYYFNQLTDISCSHYPEYNVHYKYGTASNANINAVGKVILQEDASGWQTFAYGKLGEITENVRTFVLPFENQPYTFVMKFVYDSWNRIQGITYPDGEAVSYGYNRGGMLNSIKGVKNGVTNKYLNSIRYNRFEMKDTVFYGNGTWAEYQYDTLLRLKRLKSHTSSYPGTSEVMQDIVYQYDSVGNITEISNSAGQLANGLGNQYYSQYNYDNLYRLTEANGWWENESLSYQVQMNYYPNGRIKRKYTDAHVVTQTAFSNTQQTVHYDNTYFYANNSQPNTLTYTTDNGSQQHFEWDAKGNMTRHLNNQHFHERRLCWDEQNRLLGVSDKKYLSYYQYDANGDRIYKLTGEFARQNRNGDWNYFYWMKRPTLYASPYLVSNEKGYTKHYYAENERIASRIGGGGLDNIDMNVNQELFVVHHERSKKLFNKVLECLDVRAEAPESPLKFLYEWKEIREEEKDCYWYHPDHLGSSSWITFSNGKAVEHLHYLPWGEDFVRQRSTDWHAIYTFSAKEKDAETGYSYFGARYYSSDLSVWLSVDPMADKYPGLSPYVYCTNNPVKLVDPNGEFPIKIHKAIVSTAFGSQACGYKFEQIQYGNSIRADVFHAPRSATHMDNMKGTRTITVAYKKAMSEFQSNMKAENYSDAGENLHTIADFYSHSNYVELYQGYVEENGLSTDVNDIKPYSEMMNDESFMNYVEENGGLRTGEYSLFKHRSKDPKSHYMNNLDSPNSKKGGERYGNSNKHSAARNAAQKEINKLVKPFLKECN